MTEERMALAELLQKSGDGDFLRSVAEAVLQILMEADVEGLIGAGRHERTGDRLNYRNGYRERSLDTRLGSLSLRIPKLRQGSYFPPFLEPRKTAEKALAYMDLRPGIPMRDIAVDAVFVGSCTNGRIEDLRVVADLLRGRKVADGVRMLVVPGSMRVRAQAEKEGLGEIFTAAGAEWRQAGCSMCLGMNPDQLAPGERCAATSNRNFEGRQGKGGRTHLVSPAVAAATAVRGKLSAPADVN